MERRTSDLNKRPPDDETPLDGDAIARAQKVAKTSSELRLGEVVEWNARVGYGFIQRMSLGQPCFYITQHLLMEYSQMSSAMVRACNSRSHRREQENAQNALTTCALFPRSRRTLRLLLR